MKLNKSQKKLIELYHDNKLSSDIISDKLSYIEGILENIEGKSGKLDVSSEDYFKGSVFTERL